MVEVSSAVLASVEVLALLLDMASGSARLRLSLRPMLPSATDMVDMVWAPLPLLPSLPPPLLSPPLPSPPGPLVVASLLAVLVLVALALPVPTPGKHLIYLKPKADNNIRRNC